MNKKFWYLTKVSFNKKAKSKWFIVTNIILFITMVVLLNIPRIIELFGGDFESRTNIIVVDNAGAYDIFESNLKMVDTDGALAVSLNTNTVDQIKENLTDEDLIVVLNTSPTEYLTSEIISNNKIDSLTYQSIFQALNSTKSTVGMLAANIDPNILASISSSITVDRTILNEEATTDENMDMVMSSIFPTLILPFFMLIIFLVQMVGGEICEEKTTRSMEIIIGNVSPKMHLMSKVLASNLFVILQGILLIIYCIIAYLISSFLGGNSLGSVIDFGSIINTLNTPDVNIITIEDPVEIRIEGLNQVEVGPKATFASSLRTVLRQDPNIILVGEIRDLETAEIAMQAGQTGHYVLSTIHTINAIEVITRLRKLGISDYDISSTVATCVSQRLVRRVCPHCAKKRQFTEEEKEAMNKLAAPYGIKFDFRGKYTYQTVGCKECNNTGYLGRIAIIEILSMTDHIKELVVNGASTYEIRTQALKDGYLPFEIDGLYKVLDGRTTLEELDKKVVLFNK